MTLTLRSEAGIQYSVKGEPDIARWTVNTAGQDRPTISEPDLSNVSPTPESSANGTNISVNNQGDVLDANFVFWPNDGAPKSLRNTILAELTAECPGCLYGLPLSLDLNDRRRVLFQASKIDFDSPDFGSRFYTYDVSDGKISCTDIEPARPCDLRQYPPTVYAAVVCEGDRIAINYYFHYARSNWADHEGHNTHEGDWEGMTVFLIRDGQKHIPAEVAYAQHVRKTPASAGGVAVPWSKVRLHDGRPCVYVGLVRRVCPISGRLGIWSWRCADNPLPDGVISPVAVVDSHYFRNGLGIPFQEYLGQQMRA